MIDNSSVLFQNRLKLWPFHWIDRSIKQKHIMLLMTGGRESIIRHILKEATKIQSKKMGQSILSDGSRGVWPEVRKIKWKKGKMACSIDGCNDNDDIANIFSDKYIESYNSVPYDTSEMKSI